MNLSVQKNKKVIQKSRSKKRKQTNKRTNKQIDKQTDKQKLIKQHTNKEPKNKKTEIRCDICKTCFSNIQNLKRHISGVHERQKP